LPGKIISSGFLFVDDGSTDGTLQVLENLRRSDPDSFSVCSLPRNVGKAEAVRRGLLRALEEGADYVGYWDAYLATPLEATVSFRALLDSRLDIDMVFGTRVSLLGRSIERNPLRHYLGRLFATAASLALGVGLYDTQCGAKLFRASPEVAALFQTPFRTNWIFDVEILARLIAGRRGYRSAPDRGDPLRISPPGMARRRRLQGQTRRFPQGHVRTPEHRLALREERHARKPRSGRADPRWSEANQTSAPLRVG